MSKEWGWGGEVSRGLFEPFSRKGRSLVSPGCLGFPIPVSAWSSRELLFFFFFFLIETGCWILKVGGGSIPSDNLSRVIEILRVPLASTRSYHLFNQKLAMQSELRTE